MTPIVWLLVIVSGILHASWNLATKKVKGNLAVIFMGMGLAALVSLPTAVGPTLQRGISSDAATFLLIRGVLQTLYFIGLAQAYRSGDLSFTYPIVGGVGVAGSTLLGGLLLHEKISSLGFIGIASVCLGAFLVGGNSGRSNFVRPLLMGIFTGVMVSFMSINDKLGMYATVPLIYICAMHILCFVFLLPYVLWRYPSELRVSWRSRKQPAAVIGLGSMISYLLILFAFRMGPVSYISAVRECSVVVGAILGVILLHEPCPRLKTVGIAGITLGIILIKLA